MESAIKFSYEYPRPALTVDMAILTFINNELKILLIERGADPYIGSWALPGGFIDENETVMHAAERELYEETNLKVNELRQFYVASNPGRDPRGWTISVVFMGFVNDSHIDAVAGDDAKRLKWFSINNLPFLAFDHDLIIKKLKGSLLELCRFSIVGPELLPDNFSLEEIKSLYSQIGSTNKQTDNLVTRLINKSVLKKSSSNFYSFNEEIYTNIKMNGFQDIF